MNRIIIWTATAVASTGLAVTPAVLGLAGNSSFSHNLPVRVPAGASSVARVEDGLQVRPAASTTHSSATSTATASVHPSDDHGGARPSGSKHPEPGDDRGGAGGSSRGSGSGSGHSEPGDNRGGSRASSTAAPTSAAPTVSVRPSATATHTEPGDDKGGSGHSEPGDDKGGSGHSEPGDDKGGHGGSGKPSDDPSGHH